MGPSLVMSLAVPVLCRTRARQSIPCYSPVNSSLLPRFWNTSLPHHPFSAADDQDILQQFP